MAWFFAVIPQKGLRDRLARSPYESPPPWPEGLAGVNMVTGDQLHLTLLHLEAVRNQVGLIAAAREQLESHKAFVTRVFAPVYHQEATERRVVYATCCLAPSDRTKFDKLCEACRAAMMQHANESCGPQFKGTHAGEERSRPSEESRLVAIRRW